MKQCPNTEFFSGPYFPVFELNTGKYGPENFECKMFLLMSAQAQNYLYEKVRVFDRNLVDQKSSILGHFSRSGRYPEGSKVMISTHRVQ